MPRIYETDDVIIAKIMRDHLNSWPKKPAVFMLEDIDKDAPSLMIQQLASAEKKRVYVNGSYVGVWNFAVYMRVDGEDTASKLDAIACLSELCDWLSEKDGNGKYINLPTISDKKTPTNIVISSSPSIAANYENGVKDYQVLLSLEYYSRR